LNERPQKPDNDEADRQCEENDLRCDRGDKSVRQRIGEAWKGEDKEYSDSYGG